MTFLNNIKNKFRINSMNFKDKKQNWKLKFKD